ncbi:Putative pre-16S rRNA nuclease [Candidatus Hartigia pinicola]|nr:Putative pre-16S rRNA nuclease [Candidatus Hartigia pinicola]
MSSKIFIAFDFGMKNIGVAVGQEITGTASSLSSLKANIGLPDWKKIEKILKEWQPILVIVGLPLNMNGSEQLVTIQARNFSNCIHQRFGVKVKLHDERLSTVTAKSELFKIGGYRALRKDKIDSTSAVLILESWFKKSD